MRRDLPTGTVTFLFTDVEGSTRLLHEFESRGVRRRARRAPAPDLRGMRPPRGGLGRHAGRAFFFAFPTAPAGRSGRGDDARTSVQGRIIGMTLMFVGIGFLSLLTASIASRFVKEERGTEHDEVMETLRRLEAEIAELKSHVSGSRQTSPGGA